MKPLEGVRILAVSQYGAGPYAMLHLADLGAEIIKIEDPHTQGDVARRVIPHAEDGDSLYFQAFNRNKKSVTLDLKSEAGKKIFRNLVAKSEAVFNNLRGDVPAKLGLTYEVLRAVNPEIVCCSLSGFGTTGSMKAEPAYDYLLQAMLGHMSVTGDPAGPPEKYGVSMIDFSSGIMAALGLMVGIYQAKVRGRGCDVDVSLFDTSASLLNYLAIWNLNAGYQPRKTAWSAHPSLVPSQMFPSRDGFLVVMCNKEKFFPRLCEILGVPELAEDDRFQSFTSRLEHRDILIEALMVCFRKEDTAFWLAKLSGQVPAAAVSSVEEAMQHPLLKERKMIVDVPHPRYGSLRMMGNPIKVSDSETTYEAGPALGAHNREVFGAILGLGEDELRQLQAEGTI